MRTHTLSFLLLIPRFRLHFLVVLVFLCTGCAVQSEQGQTLIQSTDTPLEVGSIAGQTFTAYFNGLNRIELYLAPDSLGSGTIQFVLKSGDATLQTSTRALPISEVTQPGFYPFDFQAQPQSNKKAYEFELAVKGTGRIRLATAPADSYLDGSGYQDNIPSNTQLTFRLNYDPGLAFLGVLREAFSWLKWVLLAVFLFVLPGLALISAFFPAIFKISLWEQVGLACGAGIAIYPLLMLWADLAGLKPGVSLALIPGLLSIGFLVFQGLRFGWRNIWISLRNAKINPVDVLIAVVVIAIFLLRFYAIRTLDYPMWGDSYQHTLITQLIVNNNGLFNSWQPYTDLQTFTYHFGFHASAAVFEWLSGMNAAKAVLVMGQILNCFAILALIPLVMSVAKQSKVAALITIITAGLISPMPMTYTDWGRYTQLAGQVILPVVIWVTWKTLEEKKWAPLILSSLLWGGLALTHYRVLIFGVLFIPPLLIFSILKRTWKVTFGRILAQGIGGGLLFLPWLLHISQGNILNLFNNSISTPANALTDVAIAANAVPAFTDFLPVWMLGLSALALIVLIWRRNDFGLVLAGWWVLIVLAANPNWLGLPGIGVLSNFAVVIAAYILVSVLIGSLGSEAAILLHRVPQKWVWAFSFPILAILLILFIPSRLADINIKADAMVTPPDQRAAAWIQQSTPPTARFLVNNFSAFSGAAVVGATAGWWLPFLAQRSTNLPPLNYTMEKGPRPDYASWTNSLTKAVTKNGLDSPVTLELLKDRGINYVYIGQENGRVNYAGPPFLDPTILTASPHYKVIYRADRVWIFEIID